MRKHQVTDGVYYLEVPEVNLRILCGCPMDSVKRLVRTGFIQPIENEKWEWQTGPNAILLSDISVQNGELCNLTEFPIMHMLYKQGMGIPEHPGFGPKPLIIGIPEQICCQKAYIERGVNGLTDEEIINCNHTSSYHKDILIAFKKRFKTGMEANQHLLSFKEIQNNEELIELSNGFSIVRLGLNVYLFQYGEDEVIIDLTLTESQSYGVPYNLDYHPTTRRDFSVIHSGSGNGWNVDHPCMASILCISGKYYLIDAGPNVLESLYKLGIGLNEIKGLFQTHAHDDHFAGIPSIIRSEYRIKFYALPLVRVSVVKKLTTLMNFNEDHFEYFFDICDLKPEEWTQIDDFEVLPVLSPHPVATNIYYFRKCIENSCKSYGHLADTISHRVHKSFLTIKDEYGEILNKHFDKIWQLYLLPVNLKKIDVNGGLIHGDPEDYIDDKSGKLFFSHLSGPLPKHHQIIAGSPAFGSEDILSPASKDYLGQILDTCLKEYFPATRCSDREIILKQNRILINAGSVIWRNTHSLPYTYIIVSGLVRWISPDTRTVKTLGVRSILAEENILNNQSCFGTYISESYVKIIRIPSDVYRQFAHKYSTFDFYLFRIQQRRILQENKLFRNIHSRKILDSVLDLSIYEKYEENTTLNIDGSGSIALIQKGMVGLFYQSTLVETLSQDSFYGYYDILPKINEQKESISTIALSETHIMYVPNEVFLKTPILFWELTEVADNMSKLISQTIRVLETTDQDTITISEN